MQIPQATFDRINSCNNHSSSDAILFSALEEIGELATEISIKKLYKKRTPSSDGVLGESVDVFICLVAIGLLEEFDFATELNYNLKYYDLAPVEYSICEIDKMKEITKCVFDGSDYTISDACVTLFDIFRRYGGTQETFLERLDKKITKWENNENH